MKQAEDYISHNEYDEILKIIKELENHKVPESQVNIQEIKILVSKRCKKL